LKTNSIARERTTTLEEPPQNRGDSRNNAHPGPDLPNNWQIVVNNNETFDTPC